MDGSGNVVVTGSSVRQRNQLRLLHGQVCGGGRRAALGETLQRPGERRRLSLGGGGGRQRQRGGDGVFLRQRRNADYYTAKYAAADGALLWEKRYNGPANGDDYCVAASPSAPTGWLPLPVLPIGDYATVVYREICLRSPSSWFPPASASASPASPAAATPSSAPPPSPARGAPSPRRPRRSRPHRIPRHQPARGRRLLPHEHHEIPPGPRVPPSTARARRKPSTPNPGPTTMKTILQFQLTRALRLRGIFLAVLAACFAGLWRRPTPRRPACNRSFQASGPHGHEARPMMSRWWATTPTSPSMQPAWR